MFIWIATLKIPTIDAFHARKVVSSSQILDRTGKVNLYDVHENVQRQIVDTTEIPDITKNAIIAVEDKEFYNHNGIVPRSIFRGLISQFLPFMRDSGGSTITQQVLKNTILSNEKSITRKVKEWVLALKIEKQMTKDEILALYLNEAPYGGTLYGISEASRVFFNKKSNQINLVESAYIAAIPNAPTYFSPYSEAGRKRLEGRKNLVLEKMFEQDMITREQYDAARDEYVNFIPQKDSGAKALHFVEYVRAYLEKKYGPDALTNEGLKVYTTLDWDLQQVAEETIKENALKNETAWNASNSALVAIDPKTGQILSMVGSRDYHDTAIDGMFNVATALRQPGSSFKPIVYARAFEKGFEPDTVLFDVPTNFAGSCAPNVSGDGCYAPQNYDNKFVGPVSLRSALGQSRNIPAVKLLYLVGIDDALRAARNLGITSLNKSAEFYGLSLVLGGGEVSLLEMTSSYATFANDGKYNKPVAILKIVDANGKVLEENKPSEGEQRISAEAARRLSSVLSDNVARSPLFGANSLLNIGGAAAKTGTTNDNKDAWLVGYTPNIAVGVWSGNNDNKPMSKGSIISGPAWNTYMRAAIAKLGSESFGEYSQGSDYYSTPPVIRGKWQGGESFWIDTISGGLATEYTPEETREEKVIPNVKSILYWINPENPRVLSAGRSDGQLGRWQAGIDAWIGGKQFPTPVKPSFSDNIHKPENRPVVTISIDPDKQIFSITEPLNVSFTASGVGRAIEKITLTYNGRVLETLSPGQPSITLNPAQYGIAPGTGTLSVNAFDDVYNKGTASKEITFTP
jgi:1A family penicillin-binding protein